MSTRARIFIVVVVACVLGAALYLGVVLKTDRDRQAAAAALDVSLPALADGAVPEGGLVVFARQSGSPDGKDGSLGVAPMGDLTESRFVETLRCDRLHMRGGRGVCLGRRGRFPISYVATVFDEAFEIVGELPLAGTPSRAQVSPSGRFAAMTVFVTGHSYADGNFSTQTSILDLETREWLVDDLETFTVRREGTVVRAVDFNFWGVTFASDDRTFYATLGTGGRTYLVRGALDTRSVDIIAEDVECPSLSPDNTRVAFKHRTSGSFGPMVWQVYVLDLQTGARHATAETRNVDDQVQWIDDDNLLYSLPGDRPAVMDSWTVAADGRGTPRMFLPASYSTVVVRR